jgi:hypothetical protein
MEDLSILELMCASEFWEFFSIRERPRPHPLEEGSFRNRNPPVLNFTQDYFIVIIFIRVTEPPAVAMRRLRAVYS